MAAGGVYFGKADAVTYNHAYRHFAEHVKKGQVAGQADKNVKGKRGLDTESIGHAEMLASQAIHFGRKNAAYNRSETEQP